MESGCPISRRRLLGVLGAGAAGAMLRPTPALAINTTVRPDRFGRLFDDLEPFAEARPKVVAGLKALGGAGRWTRRTTSRPGR